MKQGQFLPVERLWNNIKKADHWIWTACVDSRGRPIVNINGQRQLVRRIIWELIQGSIPEGAILIRKCDNQRCINPDHALLGTHKDIKRPGRPVVAVAERFWDKLKKTKTCWKWLGYIDRKGYGKLWRKPQKAALAPRISWELHYGPIPEGMSVLHRCDSPSCVRPDHLYLGTQSDNMKDRWGRIGSQK